nr:DNA translocase FtsK [Candidatus Woesebacteria bacterium]
NTANLIWEYPPLSLLEESEGGEADRGDVKKNALTIEGTLESFGIKAEVKEVNYGPSVTQYALEIARGTKLSRITGLATDLALALAAPTGQIRIEAPIVGRSLVGVEVPNYSAQYVTLRKLLSSPVMKKHPSKLATALGINVSGQPMVMDIAKMPHLLIAGATGSGKSVAINTFMCSILFRASPTEVKFILVDPKRVELTGYNDIPHLLTPVIVEPKKVVSALKWATAEMDNRYKRLAEVGVKNINGYNELAGHTAMSSIVIVIDELADIMLYAPAEVEECITRIAQMARAVGIHLVLATQRPSVDVLTGLIKANIPGRIAFNVSSMMDSRVILDTPGAEKLLGRGDMLFIPPDQAKAQRIQGTFVSDKEIGKLIHFIKSQGQQPQYEDEITTKYKVNTGGMERGGDGEERDPIFMEAAQFVASEAKGSSSLIQRRFSVGYNRAARILDQLYAAGMVGPADGSKPREVYTAKVMEYLRSIEQNS